MLSSTSTQQIKICFIGQLEINGIHYGPFHYNSSKLLFFLFYFFQKKGTVIKVWHVDTSRLMIKYVVYKYAPLFTIMNESVHSESRIL